MGYMWLNYLEDWGERNKYSVCIGKKPSFIVVIVVIFTDQVKLIQQVMSNISLPTSSIPEWARVVPEDRWKNTLLSTLENRTTHNSDSKEISE